MDINLELYKVFYYVALEQQISAAAKRLFISQPAVSQSIRLLEKKLGGPLFVRTPRGMDLTKEGQVLMTYIDQAFILIRAGEKKYAQVKNLDFGDLSLGASDTLCGHFLLEPLEHFKASYPKVKLQITNSTSSETTALVRQGSVDLGFVNLPLENTRGLEVISLQTIEDCFVYSSKQEATVKDIHTLQDLTTLPLIALEKKTSSRRFVDDAFRSQGLEFLPEIELGSTDLIFKFVHIGLGLGCVTRSALESQADDNFRVLNLRDKLPKRSIGMIYKKTSALSSAAQKFSDLILASHPCH